jgi:hypothetical protein
MAKDTKIIYLLLAAAAIIFPSVLFAQSSDLVAIFAFLRQELIV